ncbi:MAG TPA: response regulator [Thermoanaerobaculia bacterium]|nr:response regulator [Thermoanaerobaculia bacterium]
MRVLVVDDNLLNRKLLRVLLTSASHEAVEAADGIEALEQLRARSFDAVISDILMPRMDGYRLCYEIRANPEMRDLPILIYSSTYLSESDEHLAMRVGADRFIRKPASPEVILGALGQLAHAPHSQGQPEPPSQELEILKEYSEGLVRMLETRNQELEATEQRYRALFDHNPLPLWVFDPETLAFVTVNEAAIRHYGYSREEFLAMTLEDIRPPEEVARLMAIDRTSPARGAAGIWRHRKKDGTLIDVDVFTHDVDLGGRLCRLVVARDVTDQRKLEEQLRHAQKMEGLGRLASAIAHDFNNLLSVIIGYGEVLAEATDLEDYQQEITEIRRAGDRAVLLVRQLLAFSRKQVLAPKVFDLNAVVADIESMLRRLLGQDVELRDLLDPELGFVEADPGQIEQVIMNLAVNARDAMPGGGTLTIETRNVDLEVDATGEQGDLAGLQPGPHVMLSMSDTGVGMDAVTKSRLFEPFFTTKEPGKGTGLGLSTSYGIVRQSGGTMWVYTELGHGTTFKMYLPRVSGPTADAVRHVSGEHVRGLIGTETVLLVEDNDAIRFGTQLALERYGYSVLAAASGQEALDLIRWQSKDIDVLLTDVQMPDISGPELGARIARFKPTVKQLFMSGYPEGILAARGDLGENAAILEKPFTAEALARKIRSLFR